MDITVNWRTSIVVCGDISGCVCVISGMAVVCVCQDMEMMDRLAINKLMINKLVD